VPGLDVKAAAEGIVAAGLPVSDETAAPGPAALVGDGAFVQSYLRAVCARAERMCIECARLPQYAAAAYPAHKIALRLLVDCAKPRFAFFTRVVRPANVQEAARRFDTLLWGAVVAVAGFSLEEADPRGAVFGQARLRPADGGLGLGSEEERAPFAYLGSWLDSAQVLIGERDVFAEAGADSALGRELRAAYAACVSRNPDNLPPRLVSFLAEVDPGELEFKFRRPDGGVRWQALLGREREASLARRWKSRQGPEVRERLEEIGGAWVFAADVRGCVLTGLAFRVALRLRFGLVIWPALPEGASRSCCAVSKKGKACRLALDDWGHHACSCMVENWPWERHTAIVPALRDKLKYAGLLVAEERWVDALAKEVPLKDDDGRELLDENGCPQTTRKEAKLDLVVRDGTRLWYVDFTCFHPYVGSGPRAVGWTRKGDWSCAARERQKHKKYPTRVEGRRSIGNGVVVPLAANTLGAIGAEGQAFLEVVRGVARKKGREHAAVGLEGFVQSLVVYHTAVSLLAAYGVGAV